VSQPQPFFRGNELPRLVLLLGLTLGGLAYLWSAVYNKKGEPEPVVVARAPLPPIKPDTSVEFETVEDKTEIQLRDMGAYKKLLSQVESLAPGELDRIAHRDVLSIQLWERPDHYRGVPIQIVGTVLRVLSYESKLVPSGRLYEAWMVTSDSQRNFYVCVFETPPGGFPVGDNLSERIVFNGYFLKLMKYQAGKDLQYYSAPVLIGRIGWSEPVAAKGHRGPSPMNWLAIAVGLMFLVSFYRWFSGLRRSLSPLRKTSTTRVPPNEEIAPEELAAWIESVPGEDQEHDPNEDPPPRKPFQD